MTRVLGFAGLVLTAVAVLGAGAAGEEPNPRPAAPMAARPAGGYYYAVPGYWMLQMENVQKEIGLTPEQKEKLLEIARKAAEQMKNEPATDWAKFRDLTPEEQRKVQKEVADRYAQRAEESKKQIEQVLTPKQIEQIKDMEFRQRAASMLYMPQVLQQIGLTDEQKQQLQKIREETQIKMTQLQRESQDRTLGVLTPEQAKKLREQSDKGWPAWNRAGQLLEPTERPKGK